MGESCFPTTRQIAWECSLSRKAVMKHLADAEQLGWIVRNTHGFRGQRWKNHEYKPAIPEGANIVLWHESEDGIEARKTRDNVDSIPPEGGHPRSPASEKGGHPRSPRSDEGGHPDDQRWSPSRPKVVTQGDLRSSIAHQVGVQNNNISDGEPESLAVNPLATSADWLNWLVENYGYMKHRIHNASNVVFLSSWVREKYTEDEVRNAVMVAMERTGQEYPPLAYITPVIESGRKIRQATSKAQSTHGGFENRDYASDAEQSQYQIAGGTP